MKNRKKWPIVFVLTAILLIVYLINSNAILSALVRTGTDFVPISPEEFDSYSGDDYVVLEWTSQPEMFPGFYQEVYLNAVVFCENDAFHSEKKYSLFLKSDDNIYKATVTPRNGKTAMQQKQSAGYQLASDNILLNAKIPTFLLQNGLYDLYIHNYESAAIQGMCKTGLQFIKTDTGFYQYNGQKTAYMPHAQYENINLSIDNLVDTGKKQLSLSGWINHSSIDPVSQDVYIELYKDPFGDPATVYHAAKVRRSGLGDYFGNPSYDYSGYQVTIDCSGELEELLNDVLYIRFVLQDENNLLRSNLRLAYQKQEDSFVNIQWRNTKDDEPGDLSTLPQLEGNLSLPEIAEGDLPPYSPEITDFSFQYDAPQIEDKEKLNAKIVIEAIENQDDVVTIHGYVWCEENLVDSTFIMHLSCTDRTRRAYAYHVSEQDRDAISGRYTFQYFLPSAYVAETADYGFFVDNGETLYLLNEMQLTSQKADTVVMPMENLVDLVDDASILFSIDSLSFTDDIVQIVGWSVSPDIAAPQQEVFLTVYNDLSMPAVITVPATSVYRQGLGETLGLNSTADWAGYEVTMSPGVELNKGEWYIRFVLSDREKKIQSTRVVQVIDGVICAYLDM